MERMPHFFGIRHLSPAGAFFVRKFLDRIKPELVLIEGPADFSDLIPEMVRPETRPPFAMLAYTEKAPVRTVLYPFAEYSPEYQAILWCHSEETECRFFDLPSKCFLSFPQPEVSAENGDNTRGSVYERLEKLSGAGGHEDFWERTLEHVSCPEAYYEGANLFGKELRALTEGKDQDWPETAAREAYMRQQIRNCVASGTAPEKIAVICGAYHVEGLKIWEAQEVSEELPEAESMHTLMPYSYYRLSSRSGYGAGNKAPAYYELLWEGFQKGSEEYAGFSYLSKIAAHLRESGNPASTASVIEAARLAKSLALLRGADKVTLTDLRDAAVTCLGEGSFSALSLSFASVEIGTGIGSLPEGVSRTSIQEDFYRCLRDLKLEKYKTAVAQDLILDLRENRRVQSEEAAFLDLNRSFFLHRLRILEISFAELRGLKQETATYGEKWTVQWTPEVEIRIVEAALNGDTVQLAASYVLNERMQEAQEIGELAGQLEDAFLCGLPEAADAAVSALQAMSVDTVSVEEMAACMEHLSAVISFGSVRKADPAPLIPVMEQLFLHFCLLLPGACFCDGSAGSFIMTAIERVNHCVGVHEFLEEKDWEKVLREIARRDDLNAGISGYAAALLLEKGILKQEELNAEVSRRLSKGTPADLGAGWFEGLARKNHYALICRLSLWTALDGYLEELDDDEFKRALLFLRRAFADFSAAEKDQIAENLGETWGLNGQAVSEIVNAPLGEEARQMLDDLGGFDFDF